jgi:hypothetical protein
MKNHLRIVMSRTSGSSLLLVLGSIAVLSTIGATSFLYLQQKYRSVHQVAAWQEALLAAESGVDLAMAEIRSSLADPGHTWSGWNTGQPGGDGASLNPSTAPLTYTSNLLLRKGEGAGRSDSKITVDSPASLVDARGERAYRIRSLGVSELSGGRRVAAEKADGRLRKLNLVFDRFTGNRVVTPNATRLVEVIAAPVGAFGYPILGDVTVEMNNHNIVIDSYDSRDAAKSTNGRYDEAKRQQHGNIATNGPVLGAGNAHVYGGAYTNGGEVLNTTNITGPIENDFYQHLARIARPATVPDMGTPAFVTKSTTLTASTGTPARYQLSRIALAGDDVLRIEGDPAGRDTFIEIVVTDEISVSGRAQLVLAPGVFARVFFDGDVTITGNGIANPGTALNLQLYGIEPKVAADGEKPVRDVKIAGNANFLGTVYAPDHDLTFVGGGTDGASYGSFVGRSIRVTGNQSIHYDESLAGAGLITDYKLVSWFEDAR